MPDAVQGRRRRRRDHRRRRARRRATLGAAHRPPAARRGRRAPGHGIAAQRPLHEAGRRRVSSQRNTIMGIYPTKDGRWSYLHCNFPNHRAAALRCSACRRTAPRSPRRWRTGTPPISRRRSSPPKAPAAWCARTEEWTKHPQAAAIASLPLMEIVQDRRQPAGAAAQRRPAAVGHPRARHDARARRPDLRAHARRARRGCDEDHRRASAQPRLPGMGHRPRQAVGAARPARAGASSRRCAGWSARPTCSRRATGRARSASRGLSPEELASAAAGPRLCLAVGVQPCRARGRRGAASTPWCRRSAASPRARASSSRARSRARNSIRCRRSTIAPAT